MPTSGSQKKDSEAKRSRTHEIGDEPDIERPAKKRVTERIRSSATASLDTLRDLTLRLSGLKIDVDATVETSEKLFALAHFMYEFALEVEGPNDTRLADDLKSILESIFTYEKELEDDSEMRKIAAIGKHREKVNLYREELDDAWTRYQASVMNYLLGAVHRLGSEQRQQDPTHPIPLDRLLPILPTYLATYVGHEEEVKTLVQVLVDLLSAHVVILGGGGMGKTALAAKGMYDPSVESKFGNRRFFINCDGVISAEGIVAALADVFKVAESQGGTKQQTLSAYLRSLRTSMLIVLDNLESAWDTDDQNQVEAFVSDLCSIELLAVVVTMRGTSPPYGPTWHQKTVLKPLPQQDSHNLFIQIYPAGAAASEDRSLRELLKLLDGLPLAITLMASVAVTGYSPSELLAAYRDERTAMVKRGRGKDRLSNLEVSISVSIHCQTMAENPEALRLLEVLALLPDGLQDDDRTATLPSMTQYPSAARVLVQVALCSRNAGVTRVLAPIREYVQVVHPPREPHLEHLRHYHFQLALRGWNWNEEPRAVTNELGPKMANIQSVLRQAMKTTVNANTVLASLLGLSYFSYIAMVGDCKLDLQLAISAYGITGHSQSSIKQMIAQCMQRLGEIVQMRHDKDGASAALTEAKAMFEDIGHRLGAAQCTKSLGEIMQMRSDYDGATAALTDAKAVFEDIGDRLGAAQCTRSLGEIMQRRCDYDGATAALTDAKAVFGDIGDRLGAAQCTRRLGEIMQMRSDYDGATAALKEARAMFEDIGERLGAAWCTWNLGQIMQWRDDFDGATPALTEAKAMFEDVGDRLGAAQCTRSLGEIMKMRYDDDGAAAALTEAKAMFEAIGDRLGAARCTRDLGEIMRMRYDYHGATAAMTEAKATFEELGSRLGAAQCTRSLGEIMKMRYDYDGAAAALTEAKATFEDVGDRLGAAQCTRSLGEIMKMRDDYDGAAAALTEAKAVFEDIGDRLGAALCTQNLGEIMQMRNDYDGATAALTEAKAMFEEIGSRLGASQCTQSLGKIMQTQYDYDGATAALTEAKATFEEIGSRLGAAQCTQTLGEIMKMRNDYDGATGALKEAKATFEEIGIRLGASQCTQSLGEILQMRDDYDGATAALKEAKAMFEDIGSRLGAAQCTRSLGEIRQMQDDYNGATGALKDAKAMFEDIGEWLGAAQCTQTLGEIMQIQDDYDGAAAALMEAKAMFEDIGEWLGAADCARSLEEIEQSQAMNPSDDEDVSEPSMSTE